MNQLTEYDKTRYGRQMMLEGWGEEGQARLKQSTVFIAGAGGLGSPVSMYLAAAGIGHLRLADLDALELSNLNRQILYTDADVGSSKAERAGEALRRANPQIEVVASPGLIAADSIDRLAGDASIVVDCLDNYETRFLLNDYCLERGIPLVHGGIWGLQGQATFIRAPDTPCLQCTFPQAPPKAPFPVAGATPGLIGCIQAMEVLKFLTGVGDTLEGRLLYIDGQTMEFQSLKTRHRPDCPACGSA